MQIWKSSDTLAFIWKYRTSPPEMFWKIHRKTPVPESLFLIKLQASGLKFRNFAKSTGKHLCQCLFFNKVVGLRSAILIKKRLWHRCFPGNFVKFLRTYFLTKLLRWLLLKIICQRLHIKIRFRVRDMGSWDIWKLCLQTLRNNRIRWKLSYFFRNLQTARAKNSIILKFKEAKFSGYCFHMNTNIQVDFQIYISVPMEL